MEYDGKKYWQERLESDFSLNSIGYKGLGLPYNRWLYRKRARVFKRVLRLLNVTPETSVVEIGPGNGFYVSLWNSLGVKKLVGFDITQVAVANLKKSFPSYEFYQADITSAQMPAGGPFSVVTAFDVIFHIPDDELFERAMKNASSFMSDEGTLLITDCVFDENTSITSSAPHFRARSERMYEDVLERHGLAIIARYPVFSYMHPRIVFSRRQVVTFFSKVFNRLLTTVLRLAAPMGFVLGPVLYFVDCVLDSLGVRGRSVQLLVIKRSASGKRDPLVRN